LGEEKSKHAGLAQENPFWLSIIAKFAVAGKRRSNVVHLHKKSVIK
jgi:hypothetical protein